MSQASQSENKLGESKEEEKKDIDHNKYYYDYDRNKGAERRYNYNTKATPEYYIGKVYGYKAKDIIYDYGLTYNLGTSLTYILRAGNKEEAGLTNKEKRREDIQKAINHLLFELEQ